MRALRWISPDGVIRDRLHALSVRVSKPVDPGDDLVACIDPELLRELEMIGIEGIFSIGCVAVAVEPDLSAVDQMAIRGVPAAGYDVLHQRCVPLLRPTHGLDRIEDGDDDLCAEQYVVELVSMEAQRLFRMFCLFRCLVVVETLGIHAQKVCLVDQHDIRHFALSAVDVVQESRCLIDASVACLVRAQKPDLLREILVERQLLVLVYDKGDPAVGAYPIIRRRILVGKQRFGEPQEKRAQDDGLAGSRSAFDDNEAVVGGSLFSRLAAGRLACQKMQDSRTDLADGTILLLSQGMERRDLVELGVPDILLFRKELRIEEGKIPPGIGTDDVLLFGLVVAGLRVAPAIERIDIVHCVEVVDELVLHIQCHRLREISVPDDILGDLDTAVYCLPQDIVGLLAVLDALSILCIGLFCRIAVLGTLLGCSEMLVGPLDDNVGLADIGNIVS